MRELRRFLAGIKQSNLPLSYHYLAETFSFSTIAQNGISALLLAPQLRNFFLMPPKSKKSQQEIALALSVFDYLAAKGDGEALKVGKHTILETLQDIHGVASVLRHSKVTTTAEHYSDLKIRPVVNVDGWLVPEAAEKQKTNRRKTARRK
jgi:hypothetical protein